LYMDPDLEEETYSEPADPLVPNAEEKDILEDALRDLEALKSVNSEIISDISSDSSVDKASQYGYAHPSISLARSFQRIWMETSEYGTAYVIPDEDHISFSKNKTFYIYSFVCA